MKPLSISAAIGAAVLTVLQVVEADLSKIVRVNPDTQHFIDAQGRSRFFHGTNMVKKSFPWHLDVSQFVPGRSIVDKDIQALKALNINSVRLGMGGGFVIALDEFVCVRCEKLSCIFC